MNIHEELFVRNFITPAKRHRYLSMLESKKSRDKIIAGLYHCLDLDERYATLIQPNEQHFELIYKNLKSKGATDRCYAMSTNKAIDTKELELLDALELVIGQGDGALVSCIPGKLAYFELEDPGERYMLER